MNRREFLGAGVVTAAMTAAGPANAIAVGRRDAIVVFDNRFEEARRFAAAARGRYGLPAFGFSGDATSLWHDTLASALGEGQAVIGLTAGGTRFCLQLLSGPGIRITHHVTHTIEALAPKHVCWTGVDDVGSELHCAPAWPELAAQIAFRRVIEAPRPRVDRAASREYPAYRLPAAQELESWVLAPAAAMRRTDSQQFAEWNR